jgi:predicted Zn-dependent peptidase
VDNLSAYLGYVALGQVLASGSGSRLARRLIHHERAATEIGVQHAFIGDDPYAIRHPTALILTATHRPDVAADTVLHAFTEETNRIATDGVTARELADTRTRLAALHMRRHEPMHARARAIAEYELLHGRAELVSDLPALLGRVSAEEIHTAAASLRPDRRAVLELRNI